MKEERERAIASLFSSLSSLSVAAHSFVAAFARKAIFRHACWPSFLACLRSPSRRAVSCVKEAPSCRNESGDS